MSRPNRSTRGPYQPHKKSSPTKNQPDRLWLYGRHAVARAVQNPARKIRRLAATKNAQDWLRDQVGEKAYSLFDIEDLKPAAIDRLLPAGAVHQGLALYTDPLPRARLRDHCHPDNPAPLVVLDQITDPQNIGAIFRTTAAFGAQAVIFQERRTPPLAGALAKAAAGAIEAVPAISVVNIARALEALNEMGFRTVGLAGEGESKLPDIPRDQPLALVMGAEGAGLRQLVRKTCLMLAHIPIQADMESLNVSNATAIALYEATRKAP